MLPDADMLLLSVVRDAEPDLRLGTQIPDDLIEAVSLGVPFGLVRRFGGAAVDPRYYDRASVDVQTWAHERVFAYETAVDIRTAFVNATFDQTPYELGHIAHFVEVAAPSELRTADQAGDVWRFQATYSLFLRPAAS